MKIKFLATGDSPEWYDFDGEKVTAHYKDKSETFDFSNFEEGDEIDHVESETILDIPFFQVVRSAERIEGVLSITLTQKAGKGHWRESGWIDADEYSPGKTYIAEVTKDED